MVAHNTNSQGLSSQSILKEKTEGAYKMRQELKVFVAKHEDSGWIPETHTMEGIPKFTHKP